MTLNNVGSAGTAYDDPKYYVGEVAPPGWGHTKAKKEKTNPEKPKSKIGGSAAAFKRALDDGRFKGLPGDKTKKEKTASMFKLMWSMKKKGAKPHYKPGTDEKKKKYQEDWKPEIEHVKGSDLRKKAAEKKRKEAESSLPPHLKLDVMKKAFASTNEGVTYGYKGKKYKKLPDGVKTLPGWGTDGREDLGKLKDAITDKLGITNTKKKGVVAKEESEMPNVDKKDRGAIKKRFKGLFKKDIKGTVAGVNENAEVTGGFEFETYDPNMKFRDYEFIDIIKAEPLKGTVSEASGCSDDYEKLKKKVGSKKKHDKPAITFKEFKDINTYT